jgi:hypothetical protein
LVEQAADVLRQHPRDEKLYRVIERTHLRPAPAQEIAAELLDRPSSTYTRHLTQGVARVAGWLWDHQNVHLSGNLFRHHLGDGIPSQSNARSSDESGDA